MVAIVAGLVVLAVGLVTAVALVMRHDNGGPNAAPTPSASISTTSPSPPSSKGQIQYSCLAMQNSSVDAITATNAYVEAFNTTNEKEASLADAAVSALDGSVRRVELTLAPLLPQPLREALQAFTAAARDVSGAISTRAAEEEFNTAVNRLNVTKDAALDQCDALS